MTIPWTGPCLCQSWAAIGLMRFTSPLAQMRVLGRLITRPRERRASSAAAKAPSSVPTGSSLAHLGQDFILGRSNRGGEDCRAEGTALRGARVRGKFLHAAIVAGKQAHARTA